VGISGFALSWFSFCGFFLLVFFVVGLRLLLPKILPAWQEELVSRSKTAMQSFSAAHMML
jgi:hypothetical protein